MSNKKINVKNILIYICCFVILFFPFNSTIASKIYPNYSLTYISIIISLSILLFLGNIKKIKKNQIIILVFIMIISGIELFTNKYASPVKKYIYTPCLLLPLLITLNEKTKEAFIFNVKLFSIEHLSATYIAVFFRNFYINNILSFLDTIPGSLSKSHYIYSGFNPGITTHYSTNGMYISIFCLLFFIEYLNNKTNKNLLKFIISFIALFIVGKKGAAFYTILSFIVTYFAINKEKIGKKIWRFTMLSLGLIITLYISISFIPQVTIVFDRFINTINTGGDLLTGRGRFYSLALRLWNEHLLFGCGWGNFSNYYQMELLPIFKVEYLDAHNVYLQLLCETGIIGATFIIGTMMYCYIGTAKKLKDKSTSDIYLKFSFAFQTFFLLYCFSGNPLYDAQCFILYFICIGIYLNCKLKGEIKNAKKD